MDWLETRKIPVLFAVATLLPIAALCWLGLRTLDQDGKQIAFFTGQDVREVWALENVVPGK